MAQCKECGEEVIHVRDGFTGATFPVDASPITTRGFALFPAGEGERNQRAELTDIEVFRPHNLTCAQLESPLPSEED